MTVLPDIIFLTTILDTNKCLYDIAQSRLIIYIAVFFYSVRNMQNVAKKSRKFIIKILKI